MIRDRYW